MTFAACPVNTTLGEASGTFRWERRIWLRPVSACKLQVGMVRVVFVLDNYDSFTYNLVQYLGELGAEVKVRRNDEVSLDEIEAMHPERIVVSPGPCTPQEAGISIELIRHFAGKGKDNVPV